MRSADRLLSGSALVSNTSVCEVSRLLLDRRSSAYSFGADDACRKDQMRMFDLFSLIEAVVLHERLYTLPFRPPSDLPDLSLRNNLLSGGVLHELAPQRDYPRTAKLIQQSLEDLSTKLALAETELSDESHSFDDNVRTLKQSFNIPSRKTQSSKARSRVQKKSLDLPEFSEPTAYEADYSANYASNFPDLGRSIISSLDEQSSGDYDYGASILRDIYYIVASEHFSLPYWPQFTRIELARRFPNYFDATFRTTLYRRVAEGFKATVTDVFDDLGEQLAFIPPFSALVFERSKSPQEIPIRILEVREEFARLRVEMSSLEEARLSAATIKDRKRIRQQERLLLESAAKGFENPRTVRLEGVIRYVPELVKPIAATADPTSYSADLLLKPIGWLIEWWRRRPVAAYFDLGGKIERIKEYETLIRKVFGDRFYYAESWTTVIPAAQSFT